MDLIPKPDQVVSAASNVAHQLFYGGLADLRPMARTLVDEGPQRQVYHYRPSATARPQGDPVLLVTPLAAPAICFDLRRGCSLVEHLVEQGRPTYLVEYGGVAFRDRNLGMEHWVDEVLPRAIEEASAHAGGRPVHVVGWSLGGIFALLAAADRPDLPIASLSAVGSPTDVSLVPLVAPLRPLLELTGGRGLVTRTYRAVGAAPVPLVRWAFQLSSFQKLVTKPLAVATHLDDADFLAQLEAVDRFTDQMSAYPGRSFGQLYHRFIKGNALVGGSMELGGRTISLSAITAPVLVLAGATDGIAPVAAVRAVLPHLSGSREPRFEIVPGGHLGMLTGRAARTSTWAVLDEWVDEWSGAAVVPPRKRAAARKKAPAKKAAPRKKAASKEAIGANPTRRYGSGGSRALSR
ncbi:alpha/beta fold hydrolase [Nocardioides lianchengensis]|uniref:Polyhydroxyalkanoate synthase n=1 Tax=Nocardioides lianchengensis TaxID=1045774 RepID=A0A1G6I0F7_9ACTN|nr:alpha/beta fold hydrolase [Nocardioides lianchengensis]NYG13215.1 polyhydroxyalkanoate synthase [Nocardioides lianchengensis]SDB99944.1 polyhydroxyalkanoate synthase [Nocardioides lianchengensis]